MIDIHSHLLPFLDDGPTSYEESFEMLKAYVEDGVEHIVVTPHYLKGRYENTLSVSKPHFEKFKQMVKEGSLPVTLQLAGEVRFDENILSMYDRDELPFLGTFDGYKTLLVEFPDGSIPEGAFELIDWMISKNIRPIIAHPERNKSIIKSQRIVVDFVKAGSFTQITAGSFLGLFGPIVKNLSMQLLENNLVDIIASDAHSANKRRPCMLESSNFLKRTYGHNSIDNLVKSTPAKVCGIA